MNFYFLLLDHNKNDNCQNLLPLNCSIKKSFIRPQLLLNTNHDILHVIKLIKHSVDNNILWYICYQFAHFNSVNSIKLLYLRSYHYYIFVVCFHLNLPKYIIF